MANEISIQASLTVAKNGASIAASMGKTLDMAGTEMISSVQQFSTSDSQAVSFGGNDTVGQCLIKNLDTAATLTVSVNTTHTQVISVIQPGCAILISGCSTTMYAKSSSGTIDVFVAACEA